MRRTASSWDVVRAAGTQISDSTEGGLFTNVWHKSHVVIKDLRVRVRVLQVVWLLVRFLVRARVRVRVALRIACPRQTARLTCTDPSPPARLLAISRNE